LGLIETTEADVLMATVCVPFTFVANVLLQHWPFGGALCPLIGYSQVEK